MTRPGSANYSCAPLLVSDADGTYLHTDSGAYCAWDTATNAVVEAAPSQGEDDGTSGPESTWALTGHFEVNGVACHPTMDDLVAEVQKWTPDRAAEITGVDAAVIEQLALDYAKAQPAAIQTWHRLLTLLPWLRNLPSDRDTFRPLRLHRSRRRRLLS